MSRHRGRRHRDTSAVTRQRKRLIAARGDRCEACRWQPIRLSNCPQTVTVHHLVPRGDGGDHTDENGVLLCPNCHSLVHGVWGVPSETHRYEGPQTRPELLRVVRLLNHAQVNHTLDPAARLATILDSIGATHAQGQPAA